MDSSINKIFKIYSADGNEFSGLELKKSTEESVVMSLGDKISGDVYYNGSDLVFTMKEYIVNNGVKYVLVNPPTVVREGLVKDNSGLNGMTKYSLTFYHPMYMLGNFPFTDKAVTQDEENYLSQDKTFFWVGNLFDFCAKINVNLEDTEWLVVVNISKYEEDGETITQTWKDALKLSEVLSFDKQFVSDALKAGYDSWKIPFVIDTITDESIYENEPYYTGDKKYVISFGLPTQEIYETEDAEEPFEFQFGQGVGLKNNSRNPKKNKIITRIVGYGSERNIPYGYPQIPWTGNQDWNYTINNDPNAANSYPIYKGIVGGQYIKLIKHPFTRKTLMPTIYADCVNKKVNPYAEGYNPDIEIVDYYDAISEEGGIQYPNEINPLAPSVEIHQFEDEYPHLGDAHIVDAFPIDANNTNGTVVTTQSVSSFISFLNIKKADSQIEDEKNAIQRLIDFLTLVNTSTVSISYYDGSTEGNYVFNCVVQQRGGGYNGQWVVWYTSNTFNVDGKNLIEDAKQSALPWDDTMDDNGEYVQSYFKFVLPQLSFDLYACASITEQMQINMRSGACQGCTFDVQVDWDDYKRNFYDSNGDFAPTGAQRDYTKYPDSSQGSIEVVVKKDLNTFGTLMPNMYQYPKGDSVLGTGNGDKFVFLGISLPLSYITTAQTVLDATIKQYMLDNNVYYYEYPLKFDEFFLATNYHVLSQIKNNVKVRFLYNEEHLELYIKQISVKYGDSVLPQWDITLTDNIEVVLNKIGQNADEIGRLRTQVIELQNNGDRFNSTLSRVESDIHGKTNKFYYYAGSWDDNDMEFVVNDSQAPFFDYTHTITDENDNTIRITEYWMFNPSSNGVYSMHSMGVPNKDTDGWERMNTDFKYLITEAVFGNYAHFGSAIINGDWLISQHGTIDGVASTNYIAFDPLHPNDNTGTNFIPNYCVDLLTGASYQQNAYIRGEIHSDKGEIGGFAISHAALTNDAAIRGNYIRLNTPTGSVDGFNVAIGGLPVQSDGSFTPNGSRVSSIFEATSVDTINVAIAAKGRKDGAARGFALYGIGHIVTSGAVCGFFPNFCSGGSNTSPSVISLRNGTTLIISDTSGGYIYLPTIDDLRFELQIPDDSAFAIEITILFNGAITLLGKQSGSSSNYPILRDNDFDAETSHSFTKGEVAKFMLTWSGGDYDAWLVSYSYRNF